MDFVDNYILQTEADIRLQAVERQVQNLEAGFRAGTTSRAQFEAGLRTLTPQLEAARAAAAQLTGGSGSGGQQGLLELTRGIQDVQFGFAGLGNNLQRFAEIAAQGGGAMATLRQAAAAMLTGPGGLIVGITALTAAIQNWDAISAFMSRQLKNLTNDLDPLSTGVDGLRAKLKAWEDNPPKLEADKQAMEKLKEDLADIEAAAKKAHAAVKGGTEAEQVGMKAFGEALDFDGAAFLRKLTDQIVNQRRAGGTLMKEASPEAQRAVEDLTAKLAVERFRLDRVPAGFSSPAVDKVRQGILQLENQLAAAVGVAERQARESIQDREIGGARTDAEKFRALVGKVTLPGNQRFFGDESAAVLENAAGLKAADDAEEEAKRGNDAAKERRLAQEAKAEELDKRRKKVEREAAEADRVLAEQANLEDAEAKRRDTEAEQARTKAESERRGRISAGARRFRPRLQVPIAERVLRGDAAGAQRDAARIMRAAGERPGEANEMANQLVGQVRQEMRDQIAAGQAAGMNAHQIYATLIRDLMAAWQMEREANGRADQNAMELMQDVRGLNNRAQTRLPTLQNTFRVNGR